MLYNALCGAVTIVCTIKPLELIHTCRVCALARRRSPARELHAARAATRPLQRHPPSPSATTYKCQDSRVPKTHPRLALFSRLGFVSPSNCLASIIEINLQSRRN